MSLIVRLKKIRMKRKYTVYGFIREIEKDLEIPSGIIDLFIIFYGNGSDQWDSKLIPKNIVKLDKENQTVSQISGASSNVYMKRIVESGHHEWKMRLKYNKNVGGSMMIGLWRIQKNKTPPICDTYYTYGTEQGYGFHCSSGELINPQHGFGVTKEYGIKVTDSIIDMIVDFHDLSLSFKIDGIDYGKAFDITQDKYRVAVYLNLYGNLGGEVQILE